MFGSVIRTLCIIIIVEKQTHHSSSVTRIDYHTLGWNVSIKYNIPFFVSVDFFHRRNFNIVTSLLSKCMQNISSREFRPPNRFKTYCLQILFTFSHDNLDEISQYQFYCPLACLSIIIICPSFFYVIFFSSVFIFLIWEILFLLIAWLYGVCGLSVGGFYLVDFYVHRSLFQCVAPASPIRFDSRSNRNERNEIDADRLRRGHWRKKTQNISWIWAIIWAISFFRLGHKQFGFNFFSRSFLFSWLISSLVWFCHNGTSSAIFYAIFFRVLSKNYTVFNETSE